MIEEFGAAYRDYAARTPAFIPRFEMMSAPGTR
jgi:protein-S-isoprenylcysteine O-methyltransferase Ste14